ncbi:MAG: hypothetical protein LAT82_04705 [Nanoarchaeota archaeon]|nr:hypothetical protein [Nanoarchaeota archaeon]
MSKKLYLGDILIYNKLGTFFDNNLQSHPQNVIVGFDRKNGFIFPRYEARVLEGNGIECEAYRDSSIHNIPQLRVYIPLHYLTSQLEKDRVHVNSFLEEELDRDLIRKIRFPNEIKSLFSVKKKHLYVPNSIQTRLL